MTSPESVVSAADADPDFPIEWQPGEAALEWEWDDMHTPRALPPLSVDYLGTLERGFAYGYRSVGHPATLLVRVWNGYAYFAYRIDAPEEEHAAIRAAAPDRYRSAIPRTMEYWQRSLVELQAMYAEIEAVTGTEPPAELAAAWNRSWEHVGRAWEIHFNVINGPYQILDDLADRYEQLIEGASSVDALELVAGTVPELYEVDRDLEGLIAAAAAEPSVADRLASTPSPTPADLEGLPGAASFLAQLDTFLERHGHLGTSSEDLMDPSWRAEPGPLLADVGRRIGQPPGTVDARWAGRAAAAERRREVVRATLADRPAELAELEALADTAREIAHLTESHNYWIDRMASDRLWRLTRRVGRRLVADGVLDGAEDVVFLRRAEVAELLGTPQDRRDRVEERRALHERERAVTPPRKVGTIKPVDPAAKPDRFDGVHVEGDDATVRGTGASAGVIRATARIVFSPDDFVKVQPGDIVIATASNPGWVPLFATAGGFVTDTGGVLSHAAVVAREFGIPAVVGTGEGTKRIARRAEIEIDGTAGRRPAHVSGWRRPRRSGHTDRGSRAC